MAREGSVRRIGATIALTLLVLAPAASGSDAESAGGCGSSELAPGQATEHQLRSSMLCLINRAREVNGLHRLSFDKQLRSSATRHSRDMVAHRYFSHTGSGGSAVSKRIGGAGYRWSAVGEVIGGGPARNGGSAFAVFQRWMYSASHRSVILQPRFRDFGVGVCPGFPMGGGHLAATFTVDFAEPG